MYSRRKMLSAGLGATLGAAALSFTLPAFGQNVRFNRVASQYIAALGPEDATEGDNAHTWGHWATDPGPIGVWLRDFETMQATGGIGPTGWKFDKDDWWLDENGLLMKAPVFPMPAGMFLVTNGTDNIAMLTVDEPDSAGKQGWRLSNERTLLDVTHLKCRSARYRPASDGADCTPANADQAAFPLPPAQDPPAVENCDRQVYAVPIIFAVAEVS